MAKSILFLNEKNILKDGTSAVYEVVNVSNKTLHVKTGYLFR